MPLQPLSSEALLKAREAATERFLAAATAIKNEAGVMVHITSTTLSGYARPSQKMVKAPEGRTRKQLYVLAVQCAHVKLGHASGPKAKHAMEAEAVQWAHDVLHRHRVQVPHAMTIGAKKHVSAKIDQAKQRGAKTIDPGAKAFARKR